MTTKTLEIPAFERVPEELLLRCSMPVQSWQLATPTPMLRLGGISPYRTSRREFSIGAGGLPMIVPLGCGRKSGRGGHTDPDETREVVYASATGVEIPGAPQHVARFEAV